MEGEWHHDIEESIAILAEVPGGRDVIAWFGGLPEFGDAEVLELRLVRGGSSVLRLAALISAGGPHMGPPWKHATFEFALKDLIDVHIDGFSHQNVIGGLRLRRAKDRALHPSHVGIGLAPGDVDIQLAPCSGAFGAIRCTIEKITIAPANDYSEVKGA